MSTTDDRTEEYAAELAEVDHLSDDERMLTFAREHADDQQFMQLLAAATTVDEEAQERARVIRRRLNRLIAVGLERKDINNRRMAETTGIKERDLYKRKDRKDV